LSGSATMSELVNAKCLYDGLSDDVDLHVMLFVYFLLLLQMDLCFLSQSISHQDASVAQFTSDRHSVLVKNTMILHSLDAV
jgi:hypothetical protein